MTKNDFTLAKAKSKWYPLQIITNADEADDIVLPTNTPTLDESQVHSLKNAAGRIGLHVNKDKMECMCFNQNQNGHISTQK